jgi:hypothetical protein
MKALVVYESMFGNTRRIAQEVARALGTAPEVRLLHADSVAPEDLADVDLVVMGAPTHAWGLPRAATRRAASSRVVTLGGLVLEPGADTKSGVRELLALLHEGEARAWVAAFDTRRRGPGWLTGRAAAMIASALSRLGLRELVQSESFLVDRRDHLLPGELERAFAWGANLRHEAHLHVAPAA